MGMRDAPEDEKVRIVSRMCGVAISMLVIIMVFRMVLGIDLHDFFSSIAQPAFVAAASR